MKLLLDENLSYTHSERLRLQGLDAVGAVESELAGKSDDEVRRATAFKMIASSSPSMLTSQTFFASHRKKLRALSG